VFEIIFIVILIIPVALILGGIILRQCALSDINSTVGYRTERSMSSKEAWTFANRTCGNLWITGGIISVILSVAIPLILYILKDDTAGLYAGIIILVLQVTAFILSVATVEKKLVSKLEHKK